MRICATGSGAGSRRKRCRISIGAGELSPAAGRAQALPGEFGKYLCEAGHRIVAHIENIHLEVETLARSDKPPVQMPGAKRKRARRVSQPTRPARQLRLEDARVDFRRGNPL